MVSWDAEFGELRVRCRVRLLALAGELDGQGLRCRLDDGAVGGALLRVWDPARQGRTVMVSCGPGRDGRLWFCYHPSGVFLADAEEPGDSISVARRVVAVVAGE